MFSTMKVSELKLELKKLGLKSSGRKHELISRLSGDTQQPTKRVKVQAPVSVVDTAQYVTFFQQYADEDNEMLGEGITKFCADLQVDPEDIVLLILSWYMGAETMCVFTQDEFVKGMMAIRCTTIAQLSARLHEIRNMALNQNEQFMKIYHYAFDFGKEISQRSMAVEMALALWELMLPGKFFFLKEWLEFVKANQTQTITRDVWKQTLEFAKQIQQNLNNFDENGAWPVLLDDFVDHLKEKAQGQ